jgi:hypothetical protein
MTWSSSRATMSTLSAARAPGWYCIPADSVAPPPPRGVFRPLTWLGVLSDLAGIDLGSRNSTFGSLLRQCTHHVQEESCMPAFCEYVFTSKALT